MYMLAVGQQSPGTDIHHAQGLQTRSNDRCIPLRMSKERCKFFRVLKGRNQLQPMNFRQLGIFRSWFWRKGNMPCIWAHTAKPLAALAGCGCLKGQVLDQPHHMSLVSHPWIFDCTVLMLLQCLQTSASFSSQPGTATWDLNISRAQCVPPASSQSPSLLLTPWAAGDRSCLKTASNHHTLPRILQTPQCSEPHLLVREHISSNSLFVHYSKSQMFPPKQGEISVCGAASADWPNWVMQEHSHNC